MIHARLAPSVICRRPARVHAVPTVSASHARHAHRHRPDHRRLLHRWQARRPSRRPPPRRRRPRSPPSPPPSASPSPDAAFPVDPDRRRRHGRQAPRGTAARSSRSPRPPPRSCSRSAPATGSSPPTTASDFPAEAVALPDVATFGSVDVEKIVDLGADLVVAGGLGFTPPGGHHPASRARHPGPRRLRAVGRRGLPRHRAHRRRHRASRRGRPP